MSAEAFRNVMKNIPELKYWAIGQLDTNSVLHQTRESSKAEIRKSSVDFILPVADLEKLVGNKSIAKNIVDNIQFDQFQDWITVNSPKNGTQVLIFKEVNFDNLNNIIAKTLEGYSGRAGLEDIIQENRKSLGVDKGHVYGWANTLVKRTQASIESVLKSSQRQLITEEQLNAELAALEAFINSLLNSLEKLDQAASSLGNELNADIYAKYKKTDSSWLIQYQGSASQQKTGSGVGGVIGKSKDTGVRGFLSAVGYQSGDALIEKAMKGMIKGFIDQGLSKTDKNFAQLQSSPKLVELVEDTLVSALSSKSKKFAKEYSGVINNFAPLKLQATSGADNLKASINKTKQKLNKLKADTKKAKTDGAKFLRTQTGQFYSLPSLQQLINSMLAKTIKQNMGTGNRRDILNLRTGRFAESVRVERMSESREGMITAFYSYMRNPYGTFSQGGRQEIPKSRDPKLLIAESIREIAAQQVKNRLRAVLV